MGVGEDEKLGEAISVTVIATGFDVDQQNDITNVEPKKVVHALEDEQIMEHDLTAPQAIDSLQNTKGDEFATEETIVYSLEDDSRKRIMNYTHNRNKQPPKNKIY